ncbi:MAG: sporulation initiation factor Spo0A C-terminal domain-containing protein [Clostridiales bacterium]|nr:sporulation initiation factor Spo0A C-terminal domain-containing protein [Clostridiales bacterium]
MSPAHPEPKSENIRKTLLRLGVTPRYVGFDYVIYAIRLSTENSQYLISVTKELYPEIAKCYRTSACSVERNIRTIITNIWKKNPELLSKIAGYPLEKQPTASEFIAIMREYFTTFQNQA